MRWQWAELGELTAEELYAALALRQRIFVVEQECAYLDADGLDPGAWHLLGFAESFMNNPASMFGHTLLRVDTARARGAFGAGAIRLSAQAHLESFYRSLGFEVTGPGYAEDGIPHLPMRAG